MTPHLPLLCSVGMVGNPIPISIDTVVQSLAQPRFVARPYPGHRGWSKLGLEQTCFVLGMCCSIIGGSFALFCSTIPSPIEGILGHGSW